MPRSPSSTGSSPNSGVSICCSRVRSTGLAHVYVVEYAMFTRAIELRRVCCPVDPSDTASPSENASSCRWQVAHDWVWLPDSRVS
jgi:hypothetical protein